MERIFKVFGVSFVRKAKTKIEQHQSTRKTKNSPTVRIPVQEWEIERTQ